VAGASENGPTIGLPDIGSVALATTRSSAGGAAIWRTGKLKFWEPARVRGPGACSTEPHCHPEGSPLNAKLEHLRGVPALSARSMIGPPLSRRTRGPSTGIEHTESRINAPTAMPYEAKIHRSHHLQLRRGVLSVCD
jgi:hypothetical protein